MSIACDVFFTLTENRGLKYFVSFLITKYSSHVKQCVARGIDEVALQVRRSLFLGFVLNYHALRLMLFN